MEAKNEQEAQKIFEQAPLTNPKYIAEGSVIVDDKDSDWTVLEEIVYPEQEMLALWKQTVMPVAEQLEELWHEEGAKYLSEITGMVFDEDLDADEYVEWGSLDCGVQLDFLRFVGPITRRKT